MGGGRKVRLSDVAEHAGVSPATVSRANNQPDLLSPSTLARVQKSTARLGYVPGGAGRALASGRSRTIGAIVPTLDSAIFARALQSMQVTLAQEGFLLLVASHESNALAETQAVRALLERGVDGLMLVGAERAPETIAMLKASAIPVILTWRGDGNFPSVAIDNARAGFLAAKHLIDLGHRRIGIVTGYLHFNDRQKERMAGARQALREAGLPMPDQLATHQALTLAGGRLGCATLLELKNSPTAIIGAIDLLAIGCIEEGRARGIDIPAALSVSGIDDLEMSAHLSPSLTTVRVPTQEIGRRAALKLIELTSGSEVVSENLAVELIVRRSTAPNA